MPLTLVYLDFDGTLTTTTKKMKFRGVEQTLNELRQVLIDPANLLQLVAQQNVKVCLMSRCDPQVLALALDLLGLQGKIEIAYCSPGSKAGCIKMYFFLLEFSAYKFL